MECTIVTLLGIVKSLAPINQRAIAAILGAAVADSAIRPFHWVYDVEKIKSVAGDQNPEFWPENQSGFHIVPLGEHTSYFGATQVGIDHLKNQNGVFNLDQFANDLEKVFGDEQGPYQVAYQKRLAYKQQLEQTKGKWDKPVEGPWINGSVLKFLENRKNKVNPPGHPTTEDQDAFCSVVPLAVLQALRNQKVDPQNPELVSAIRLINNNDENISLNQLSIRAIQQYILDPTYDLQKELASWEVTQDQRELINDVIENIAGDHTQNVQDWGPACGNPGNFQGSLHTVLQSKSYTEAVRNEIRAGGDQSSRAIFSAAAVAARYGINSIPEEWISKTNGALNLLQQLVEIYK